MPSKTPYFSSDLHFCNRKRFLILVALIFMTITPVFASSSMAESTIYYICADPHVGHDNYNDNILVASQDFNQEEWDVEKIVVLGDLVEYGVDNVQHVPKFVEHMNTFNVSNWTYVLGNHDHDRDTNIPVKTPRYWSEEIHGIKLIFLTDESRYSLAHANFTETEQYEWLLSELDSDPEQPKLIFSHVSPLGTPIEWFENLDWETYNLWAWIHGHHRGGRKTYRRYAGRFWEVGLPQLVDKSDGIEVYGSLLEITPLSSTETHVNLSVRRHDTKEWSHLNWLSFSINVTAPEKPYVFDPLLVYIPVGVGVLIGIPLIWKKYSAKRKSLKAS